MQEHLFYLTNYTNNEIKQALNSFLSIEGKELNGASFNCFHIGELIMSITNEPLLKASINLLIGQGYIQNAEQPIFVVDRIINQPEFTAAEAIRIKAICYGILLKYMCYIKKLHTSKTPPPNLQFSVSDGKVFTNLDEVIKEVNNYTIKNIKNSIKEFPKETQVKKLKKVISAMAEISIDNDTDEFKSHIERLSSLKENLPEKEVDNESEEINKHKNKIWFKFGLLIVRGKITQKRHYYYYEGIEFDSEQSVSLYIGEKILNLTNPKSLRPYFNATLRELDNDKNIYGYKKINIIYDYCKRHKILMSEDFIEKKAKAKRY